jgi:hypothetical protein
MKNTHVQAFELIEGSFDSSTWLCVVFSVYYAHECLLSCMHLLCICYAYDFMFQLKSEREKE